MNAQQIIETLPRTGRMIEAAVEPFLHERAGDARWKPADGAWSVLEIICHLGDEEVDDFRTRLDLTLHEPQQDWPPIDPAGWAVQRRYNDGDLQAALDRFRKERAKSLAWLRSLPSPDWSSTHTHPKFGSMQAGDLLAAWGAHDVLHIRQLAKRLYQLTQRDAGAFRIEYAGEW